MEKLSWQVLRRRNHVLCDALETAIKNQSDSDVLHALSTVLKCVRSSPSHEYFVHAFEEFEHHLEGMVAYGSGNSLSRPLISAVEFDAALSRAESIKKGQMKDHSNEWADTVQMILMPLISKLSKPLPPKLSEDSVVRGILYNFSK